MLKKFQKRERKIQFYELIYCMDQNEITHSIYSIPLNLSPHNRDLKGFCENRNKVIYNRPFIQKPKHKNFLKTQIKECRRVDSRKS